MDEEQIRSLVAGYLNCIPTPPQCAYEVALVIMPNQKGHTTTVGVRLRGKVPKDFDDVAFKADIETRIMNDHGLDVSLVPPI